MIPFKNRFHGHKSLMYVYRNGQAVRSRLMTLKYTTNKHRDESRFAVVVSKKVLKSAVRRNRIRRRIYEYLREHVQEASGVHDVVVIVTSAELVDLSHTDLTSQLENMFLQAGLGKTAKPESN